MSSFTAKKTMRTYSRQAKRPLYEEEPPTKRRRVDDDPKSSEPAVSVTSRRGLSAEDSSPRHDASAPLTSSPREAPAIFSDEPQRSSPPSSPALRSSPLPIQKRRPVFSLFKKQPKTKTNTKAPLSERSHNAQSPPKPRPEKKRLVQMQLDLATQHRKTCKTCGMEYIPSNPEDALLHKKFHAMNFGGVDFTKPVIERLRKNQVWSGGDGSFIAVVGRKDAIALRNRASDVLKVVNTELAAVPISDEDLWSRTGSACVTEVSPKKTNMSKTESAVSERHGSPLVDRFKMYLHIQGNKCIGACLAERIWEAYAVLGQGDVSELPSSLQSSSISTSAVADPAMLGISRIWTSSQHRKQGIARKLLDTARSDFLYGLIVEKQQVAFSQPTESGGNLARKWFGRQAGWHVYMD